MHNYDKIVSVGSDSSAGRSVKRVFKIWDPRNVGAGALTSVELDKGRGGVVMPFYDPDTSLMYFAGKVMLVRAFLCYAALSFSRALSLF